MLRLATRPELPADNEPIGPLVATMSHGQTAMGDLYFRGDSAFYWVGAPVIGHERILGYVVQRRTFTNSPRVEQQIRDLAGNDKVSIYIASDSAAIAGRAWAASPLRCQRSVTIPTTRRTCVRYTRADGDAYVGVYARIPNTPFRMIAETPYETLLERPSAFLRRSVVVALGNARDRDRRRRGS